MVADSPHLSRFVCERKDRFPLITGDPILDQDDISIWLYVNWYDGKLGRQNIRGKDYNWSRRRGVNVKTSFGKTEVCLPPYMNDAVLATDKSWSPFYPLRTGYLTSHQKVTDSH